MFLGAQGKINRTSKYWSILPVHPPRSRYSWNTASAPSIELSPAKVISSNSHSSDHLGVISAEQWAWEWSTRCTDGLSILYSPGIPEHIESNSVLRVLALRTLLIPTEEILEAYLQYPHQYRSPRYMKHSQYLPQYKPEILRVHEVPTAVFSRTYFALVPNIESQCERLRYVRTPHIKARQTPRPSLRKTHNNLYCIIPRTYIHQYE